ncbi:zinc finger protein Xfin [Harmonia axyridis]|uniref:zinc finger protein Xfin n=1 Tax=Harmonia axyridis TaxID=115357 RepID=UPI001E27573A|nr:zinc finger protein Xfin [Harmonia axyridis]
MEVAMSLPGSAIDCYEDMFKEITRKLYGEDGLPELNVNDRLSGSIADRTNQTNEFEVENHLLKSDDHLTALGLAALMQNGFPANGILNTPFSHPQHKVEDTWTASEEVLPWTQSKVATYNPHQKTFRCMECDCAGNLSKVVEHWLGTHSNIRAFRCPQCPYESAWAKCVRMHLGRQHNLELDESRASDIILENNPVLQEITKYLQRLKTKLDTVFVPKTISQDDYQQSIRQQSVDNTNQNNKRYNCTYCPYATDRRDLFTRHENIHREEKPFQCYVCQKQFNRADHVKKHFLRMHREHPYDLNRIRRHPPKNASGMSYYQKYNSGLANPTPDAMTSSLSIPNGLQSLNRQVVPRIPPPKPQFTKSVVPPKSSGKKRGEKRFSCCYCSWSGVDNWCLKRHMNTHLKPFVCVLCDYKAARSERLTTHVLKVHNKRACGKCSFLADEPSQLILHQQEHHPLEHKNRSVSNSSVLRTNMFNGNSTNSSSPCSQNVTPARLPGHQTKTKTTTSKQHGAARLFSYMEASDGSEPEMETRPNAMDRINISHRIQSDFPEAGDVSDIRADEELDETELPLFICPSCGCEFEDDTSLDTHQYTHRIATSPAKCESKENVDPSPSYKCHMCDSSFECQAQIISHMSQHSTMNTNCVVKHDARPRRRKQVKPQKVTIPFWDASEVDILRHLNGKLRSWRSTSSTTNIKLQDKYLAQLITKRGSTCFLCPRNKITRYHTKSSAALHFLWRHSVPKFQCEHCDAKFRHRYQVILHSSRQHVKESTTSNSSSLSTNMTSQVASDLNSVGVPKLGDLGMAFFDHSLVQSTNSLNHLHIIIPTFPPN